MTPILLYWNHICVLHNYEKTFLAQLTERLRQQNIALDIRFFGLGYPEHMSEYLARPDAILPDVLVSADLEVFEDSRIFNRFSDTLYPAADWGLLRQTAALEAVFRHPALLPFVSIPLVYYTSNPDACAKKGIHDIGGLAFGGINNSAGKTLVKAVWSHRGKDEARRLLETSSVSDMPIGAFQQVRTGQRQTALVPSLYALRADGSSTFLQIPQEGPLLISSYFCTRRSVPEQAARALAEAILCPELCTFYAQNGDLILHPACIDRPSQQIADRYFVPTPDWYNQVPPQEFYALYRGALPTAKDPAP